MPTDSTPYGYCKCGCGRKTSISTKNRNKIGHVKGEPVDYFHGHSPRKPDLSYSVDRNGCWIPKKKPATVGYVYFYVNGVYILAHRYMWVMKNGPIPEGKEIDHLCRNRGCCNPDHLEAVTREVNSQRGMRTTINPDIVFRIRKLSAGGRTGGSIAREIGFSESIVRNVIARRTWRNV